MKRIYGRRPVEEFFRTKPDPSSVRRIYVAPSIPKKFMAILQPYLKGMKDRLEERSRAELDRICNGNHQGIIVEVTDAEVMTAQQTGLRRPNPQRPIREAIENHPGLYVLTDRLQDAQNLGSLIRSAEALGAMALVVSGKGVRPNDVSARISAGASQHLPVFTMANPEGFLREAREREYWVLAAAGRPETEEEFATDETEMAYGMEAQAIEIDINEEDELADRRARRSLLSAEQPRPIRPGRKRPDGGPVYLWTDELDELPENGRYILMVGHEGEGLKRSLIERSDYVISIPMHGQLSSLNVAVAGAILIERILSVRPPQRYD